MSLRYLAGLAVALAGAALRAGIVQPLALHKRDGTGIRVTPGVRPPERKAR